MGGAIFNHLYQRREFELALIDPKIDKIWESLSKSSKVKSPLGNMASPHTAWMLTRSLETLSIRMERQCSNAQEVVQFLIDHPQVERVFYPGLESQGERQNEIYRKQCSAPGAMISFDVRGGEKEAFTVLNNLKLVKLAVSLGSNESLAQHPYHMTHADMPDEEKEALGLTDQMVRLSVGIEDPQDLIADLRQALDQL